MKNILTDNTSANYKPRLLLHSCCGPCSTACIERLAHGYHIYVFYYNPCINDSSEYELRKANQLKFIEEYNSIIEGTAKEHSQLNNEQQISDKIEFTDAKYDPENFEKITKGLENEPEGGRRCSVCFRQRLEETARTAKEMGMDFFTTTLTVSPHKSYRIISQIGKEVSDKYDIPFLDMDFKKKAGFQRSIELSKEYKLYRQNYCGCNYSKRD